MAKKTWFSKGKTGRAQSSKVDVEAKARQEQRKNQPYRFWLEADSSGKITFLDTPEFFLWEHNLKMAGKYGNFFTCLKEFDVCPICEDLGEQSGFIVVATIIDHRKWTDKDGNEHKNQKKLYVARGRARQRIIKQIERRKGSLQYCAYDVARGTSQTESNVGEDIEFLKKLTKAQLSKLAPKGKDAPTPDEWMKPFDYEKMFEPKTPEWLRKNVTHGEAPVGTEDTVNEKGDDDDLPFDLDSTSGEKVKAEEVELPDLTDLSKAELLEFLDEQDYAVRGAKKFAKVQLRKAIIAAHEAWIIEEGESAEGEEKEEEVEEEEVGDIDDLL